MNRGLNEATSLLRRAQQDWEILRVIKDAPSVELAGVCFHAQQCAEKSLKAVLALRGLKYERTHNLESLAGLLLDHGDTLPVEVDALILLNPCAVALRYEDQDAIFLGREDAMHMAASMLDWAKSETGLAATH